jgi:hypothetical protein
MINYTSDTLHSELSEENEGNREQNEHRKNDETNFTFSP